MVFALDIGTRKVAGILGVMKDNKMYIVDALVREHEKRAMLDGQIHNIEEVSRIVTKIKKDLEARNNTVITKVTTAVAGRNLITETAEAVLRKKGEITAEDLAMLELDSVRKAHETLSDLKKADYYCVGYSPVHFTVDGAPIKNPKQQLARESVGVKTLVTFLPKIVFESMVSVLNNCGLELEGMTLEPIAALQVTIPEDMRLLNIALVDVGAGTSDIALTDRDKITAYGMIPKAGDEITEQVCNSFLLDFNTAEFVKRFIDKEAGIETEDIFNNRTFISYEDFKKAILPKVEEIAKETADAILSLNTKQPQAVVMVGGGSSLELLKQKIADNLGLPHSRVGSRLPKNILNLGNLPPQLAGTEGITPLGILETALLKRGLGFIDTVLNGEKQYVINLDREITLLDVLRVSGFDMRKFYGKPGDSLTFTLNGELKIIRGASAMHAAVFVNGEQGSLETKIKSADMIEIKPAGNGADAAVQIKDVVPKEYFLTLEINSEKKNFSPKVYLSGREVSLEEQLPDRADITVNGSDNIKELLISAGYTFDSLAERDIIITLSGEPVVLKQRNYRLTVNGREAGTDHKVKDMDKIEFKNMPSYYRVKDILKKSLKRNIKINVNGKPYELEAETMEVFMNNKKVSEEEFLINGASIEIRAKEDNVLLSTVFKYYPVDTERLKGKMLKLTVDGVSAGYTTPIREGSNIEIIFV